MPLPQGPCTSERWLAWAPVPGMWDKSCHPSPSLSFDHLNGAFLRGGFQEMEQLVPPAAACLPLMAGLALILRFCPPSPRGPQCGNVIQQMCSGSWLQNALGKGVGREESFPSPLAWEWVPRNLKCVIVPSSGLGWTGHPCPFLTFDFDSCFSLLSFSFSSEKWGW